MTYLVNPLKVSKEEWLDTHFVTCSTDMPNMKLAVKMECLPVCLIDKGLFSSAVIITNLFELSKLETEHGKKTWYMIPRKYLIQITPTLKEAI